MRVMKKILIFAALIASPYVRSETLSLENVWRSIQSQSVMQRSADEQLASLQESQNRASNHWLPRLYLEARTYQTNDPGAQFFGLMQQRSLSQNDFNPQLINHPDSSLLTRGALGVDWAFYEGGMKSSQSKMYQQLVDAQKLNTQQVQLSQYTQVAQFYGSLGLLDQQKSKLQELRQMIQRLVKSYQIGSRSNPVGYSGLLGMKSLENRIKGFLQQYEAQQAAYRASLNEMGLSTTSSTPPSTTEWITQFDDVIQFTDKYLSIRCASPCDRAVTNKSFQMKSLAGQMQATEQQAEMEKARYWPRLGAFAESSLFHGDRDTADSYTLGLYLQWNLFSADDFGRYQEARLKYLSGTHMAEALSQQEQAERKSLEQVISALKFNIGLLVDSQKLMQEQMQVTESLFKNGSVNALQFVEVMNRRLDLIVSQGEAGSELIKNSALLLSKSSVSVAQFIP